MNILSLGLKVYFPQYIESHTMRRKELDEYGIQEVNMAFHIEIIKESETENKAIYSFSSTSSLYQNTLPGLLEINKKDGNIKLVRAAENDESKAFFMRASRKILVH